MNIKRSSLPIAGCFAALVAFAATASAQVTLFSSNFDTFVGSQNIGSSSSSTTAVPGFTVYTTATSAVNQTTSSQLPQLPGSTNFARAQTSAGNYVIFVGAAFEATAENQVFTITADFG